MKRITTVLTAGLLALATTRGMAHEAHPAGHSIGAHTKAAGGPRTITGELVDTGCYMAHSGHGEKHIPCATKCIANGMPMGLLTSDGTVYLLTMDHDNVDPYNDLKTMAGKMVSVTGTMVARGGLKGLEVTSSKLAAASASK